MQEFLEPIYETLSKVWYVINEYGSVSAILDILLVAILIYGLIIHLRKTQSIQIINGVILVIVVYLLVVAFNMKTSQYIFESIFSNILLIIIIIFNPEIRQVLQRIGQSNIGRITIFNSGGDQALVIDSVNAVCRACAAMSDDKIGSLIIFQRHALLGHLTNDSVEIDSVTTVEMLCSIFFPNSALHDGAIIINGGRIVAARCVVPLKNDRELQENFGMRHRAALEVSRASDAVAVVTSEETGMISVAVEGVLTRGISDSKLREILMGLLIESDDDGKPEGVLGRFTKFFKRRRGE